MGLTTEGQVLFVDMPFGAIDQPSLALGLLQSVLGQEGIPSTVFHANMILAELLGCPDYNYIAGGNPANELLLGDWLFHPWIGRNTECGTELSEAEETYLREAEDRMITSARWQTGRRLDDLAALVRKVRSSIPEFLERCMTAIDWPSVKVVGFSCTYQQQVASLALAAKLKRMYPHLFVVFGGANVDGPMGVATVGSFQQVDAVVQGEAESTIGPLVRAVLSGSPWSDLKGVVTRALVTPPAPPEPDLDRLPYPSYQDYFAQLKGRSDWDDLPISLAVETSRGCWWGQKHQCVFCGFSHERMKYRSKTPQRAVDEIVDLWQRYGRRVSRLNTVDMVMDWRYPKSALPLLASKRGAWRLFYEVRAKLTKAELQALRQAGVSDIQIGIESFSSRLLAEMSKGTTALLNVQALKWSTELGFTPGWNLLWGFPGEELQDYEITLATIKSIPHLRPPYGLGPLRLERFSPLYERLSRAVPPPRAAAAYNAIYPELAQEVRDELAYYFEYERDILPVLDELLVAVGSWRRKHRQSSLFYFEDGDRAVVVDTRSGCSAWSVDPRLISLLRELDGVRSFSSLGERLGVSQDEVEQNVNVLSQRDWVIREGDSLLGLAMELSPYQPSVEAFGSLSALVHQDGSLRLTGSIPWVTAQTRS